MRSGARTRPPDGRTRPAGRLGSERAQERARVAAPGRDPAARGRQVRQRAEGQTRALEHGEERPAVLAGVADAARGEDGEEARARRRGSADVPRDRGGLVPDVAAGVADAPAEVDVLGVEEEALVPAAEPL